MSELASTGAIDKAMARGVTRGDRSEGLETFGAAGVNLSLRRDHWNAVGLCSHDL
jgi:hypothetical protein